MNSVANFVGNIPKHHSRTYASSPLGLIRVMTLAMSASQSFFITCLSWCLLAWTATVNSSVVGSSVFFMVDSVMRGNLMMAERSSLFLLGVLFRGYLGCLLSHSVLGCLKVSEIQVCVCVHGCFSKLLSCLQSHCFGLGFERGRGFLLFGFFFFHFYWSIVDLQSFYCTAEWLNYTYTYVHSLLDSFPIWSLQRIEYTSLCCSAGPY